MSHTWPSRNKHDPYQKVHFEEYLSNINEPLDDSLRDTPQLGAELLGSGYDMCRSMRRRAKRLRRIAGRP